jgi:hypothetical protein
MSWAGIVHWFCSIHWGRAGTWALAIGTFLLAFFTWRVSRAAVKTLEENKRLVDETHQLAESNKVLIESEERHHQESLMPLCVLKPFDPKLGEVGAKIFYSQNEYRETIDVFIFYLTAKIENNGSGPALDVLINFDSNVLSGSTRIGTIGAGGEFCVHDGTRPLVPLKLVFTNNLSKEYVIKNLINSDWKLCIEFSDIFGNKYHTVHKNDPDNLFVEFVRGPDNYCSKIR